MRRQLAQASPGTLSTTIFTPPTAAPYHIDLVNICNVTASTIDVSLYHDTDGEVYTAATALVWQHTLLAGEMLWFTPRNGICGYQAEGGLGADCSVDSGATYTVYGEILGEQL